MYTDEHPAVTVATATGCTEGNGNDVMTCQVLCKDDPTCNYVWIYNSDSTSSGRCCFKKSFTKGSLTPMINGLTGKFFQVTSNTTQTTCGEDLLWDSVINCFRNTCASTQFLNSNKVELNSISGMFNLKIIFVKIKIQIPSS